MTDLKMNFFASGHSCTTDTTDFRGGVWGATSNRRGSPVFTIGPAVQIRFRESDLPLLATHPLTPGLVVGQNTPPAVAVSVTAGIVPLLTPATGGETQTLDSSSFVTSLPTNAPTNTGASVGGGALSSNMAASSGAIAGASPSSTGSTQISEGNALRNGAEDSRRGLPAGIVAVLVASTLAAFAVGVALLIRFRSSLYYRIPRNCWVWPWRRRRDNSLVPVGVGAWIGQRPRCDDDDDEEVWHGTGNPHSRLVKIAEVDRHSQLSEARQPLGSRENPAEMEGDLEYVHGLTRQASWISRFLSRIPRSSTTTSSRSRWTQRSLSLSGDWETLLHEKDGGGVAVPDVVYSRPGTLSWSNSDEDIFHGKKPSLREPAKVRSFDRLSEGTFGRVLVRGKSPGASSSSMGY